MRRLSASELRIRVEQAGLKQYWLAKVLGVDRSTLRRWLNGEIKITDESVDAICDLIKKEEAKDGTH